jgi:hypothetical protein
MIYVADGMITFDIVFNHNCKTGQKGKVRLRSQETFDQAQSRLGVQVPAENIWKDRPGVYEESSEGPMRFGVYVSLPVM